MNLNKDAVRLVYFCENIADCYTVAKGISVDSEEVIVFGGKGHPLDQYPNACTMIFVGSKEFEPMDAARKLLPRWFENPDRRAYRFEFDRNMDADDLRNAIATATLIDRSPYLKAKQLGKPEADSIRVNIAAELTAKELRNLFPKSNITVHDMLDLWNGKHTLRAIEDFWNGCHGILHGFKKKMIVPLLLDPEIVWEQCIISPDQLWLSSPADFIHEKHATYPIPLSKFREELAKDNLLFLRSLHSHSTMSGGGERDGHPIIVKLDEHGRLIVIDGNRRAALSILTGHETITAYVAMKKR